MVAACSDPEIPRFIPLIRAPYTEDAGRSWLAHCEREWRGTRTRPFAIADRDSDRFLGVVTVRLREGGLVGFWLDRESRGKGVMTQAVRAVVEWARAERGIERLCLLAHPDNVASQRVAEKVGYRREGVLRAHLRHPDGRIRDSVMFSLLPGELRQ